MSEPGKAENCLMDDQETYCENAEKDRSMNSQMTSLNESQDFHLVDSGDEDSTVCLQKVLDKTEEDGQEPKQEEQKSLPPLETSTEESKGNEVHPEVDKDKTTEQEESPKNEPPKTPVHEKVDSNICNLETKEKHSDDEEVIQCTPPDVLSPSKKQVLKRKAEALDEPPKKILRTISGEDALSHEKRMLEEEESQCRIDVHKDLANTCSTKNVIIAETQDPAEEESTGNNVEVQQNENESFVEKNYEIDKNENLSAPEKTNENKTDITNKSPPLEEKVPVDGNTPDQVQTKDKDDTSIVPVDEKKKLEVGKESSEHTQDATAPLDDQSNTIDKENNVEIKKDSKVDSKSMEIEEAAPKEVTNECNSSLKPPNACKPRMSIEVIYDKTAVGQESKSKPKELVEIDEDGEKIVLDSSQEDAEPKLGEKNAFDNSKADTTYKSCYETKSSSDFSYKSISTKESSLESKSDGRLVNGSSESKRCDTDSTASLQSDVFNDLPAILDKADSNAITSGHNINKHIKTIASISKDSDNADLLSVSDNDPDVSIVDDISKSKSDSTHSSSLTKAHQVEREISMYVRLKCLLHVDETTKEFVSKEVTAVYCDPTAEPPLARQKTNDTSASLADISGNDNKDCSPGSVNSNAQLYQLNPSRLSCASTISSLSSASSAASLAAKLALRDNTHFSLPRAPAKHAKRCYQDVLPSTDKQTVDETYERVTKEWQNSRLVTTTILSFANTELNAVDPYNVSNERLDDQLQKIRSSTPEAPKEEIQTATPKSTKKGKAVKRPRSKSARAEAQSNGLTKISPKILIPADNSGTPSRKKNKTQHPESTGVVSNVSTPTKLQEPVGDELIGKEVFAKWSDNNYYPGTVIDKIKTKYKVNFYDGQNKMLIEDFVIPIPQTLREGLSVYATTKNDDYGSCGIIVDVQTTNDETYYLVETDEGDKLRVQIKDIFLSADQAQLLRDEGHSDAKSLPSTPKHLAQVTLENVVDGKRRSRRIATPSFSTPKSRTGVHTPAKAPSTTEPSVSGMASKIKKEKKVLSENEGASTDSTASVKEETLLGGVQPEITGTPNVQTMKGPQNRIKSKSRSKKKVEDEETIATLGPIPPANSTLFKGMSFILTCASPENIDRYQTESKPDTGSDPGTETEEEWIKKPFVRERLQQQIEAGGGKVYDEFSMIPQDQYKNTKLIANVPNTTAKALLCLSVGIPVYSHNWIIRCCQEDKIVNPAEDELPAGWSLEKQSYVEMFQRPSNKPLTQVIVIIPVIETEKQSTSFWRQICENAGAVVLLADKPDSMECFVEGTIVLANHRCPSWVIERANELQIPLLSTTYIVQCLIEGKICRNDAQERYAYNYIKN